MGKSCDMGQVTGQSKGARMRTFLRVYGAFGVQDCRELHGCGWEALEDAEELGE